MQTFSEYLLIRACQVIDGIQQSSLSHSCRASMHSKACRTSRQSERNSGKEGNILTFINLHSTSQSHTHTRPIYLVIYGELLTVDGIRFKCTEIECQGCDGEYSQKDNEGG